MTTLAAQLSQTLAALTGLSVQAQDADRADELRELHDQLSAQLRALVRANVAQDSADYRVANEALGAANSALAAAAKDLGKVEDVIRVLAKAADLLGRLPGLAV